MVGYFKQVFIIGESSSCCCWSTTMSQFEKLFVVKRNGTHEDVVFDKIKLRISNLCYNLNMDHINPINISVKVIQGLYPGVTTEELDRLAAEISASMAIIHTDYSILAARITISNLHKETKEKFSHVMYDLYKNDIIAEEYYTIVDKYKEFFDNIIDMKRDYLFTYFGIKTLERSYLSRINGKIVERPQHMFMRVALGIHKEDLSDIIETYNYLSKQYFIHATPTLFSAATCRPQLSSCFLMTLKDVSVKGIFATLSDCAAISENAGGIGLNVNKIPAKDDLSHGLVPMLRVFNSVARYVDQGGGKRMGSFAIYIEPWHADIFDFLNLKKNHGAENNRARDLFYGLWIPDLFMRRVESNGKWSLMCPQKCPGLSEVWGDEFDRLYEQYECENKANSTIDARKLWYAIIESQVETGTPYMLYKDACNRKSNQKNLGTIQCSNLCTEIIEYTSPDEIAVCNLASVALKKFIVGGVYDFEHLKFVVKIMTKNLNKIIDNNFYPVPEAKKSNLRHRPIGIGVQGFADALLILRYPFESAEARLLNKQIFETIYYGALEASCELAEKYGVYETYEDSPASRGILQYDMWEREPTNLWNWTELKAKIKKFGLRNSLMVAPMPTASTAQILGNNESFEPFTSNMYLRRVLSGEFHVVNQYLVDDLIRLNLWNNTIRTAIIKHRGSIQNIYEIPLEIRNLYKTVWEISMRYLLDMAADRGPFIDQSQSLNIYVDDPSYSKLSSIHFYSWKLGLKTGMYYLRTKPAADPIQFTVCSRKDKQCLSCSS